VSKLIPNYKQLSPYQFKDLLVKVISPSDYHQIEKWFTNFTMLPFIKQRAELICVFFQLKIEQDYWNYIANLITMPVVIWLSQLSKEVTQKSSINWDHTKTKINIKRRQQIIRNKLRHAECNIYIHLQQPYPFYSQMKNTTSVDHLMNIIFNALLIVTKNSLYYFYLNFQQKKILLNFDIKDAYLVKSFYDLNPTEEQVYIHLFYTHLHTSYCLLIYILGFNRSKDLETES
jgi:hypothetical protein